MTEGDGRRGASAPWAQSVLVGDSDVPVIGAGYRGSLFWQVYDTVAEKVDRSVGWSRLPVPLALAVLIGIRNKLRKENLHDTGQVPAVDVPVPDPAGAARTTSRSADGAYNDLDHPSMGMAGTRFGRNVPLDRTFREAEPQLLSPNPRLVSRRLLTRHEFQPATALNALAASWVQFMIRDWFSHGSGPRENLWQLPLEPGDDWPAPPLTIPRVRQDPTRPPGSDSYPPTYVNVNSAWWDASSIYGNSREQQLALRTGADGKLRISDALPPARDPATDPTREPGFWLGLLMMATLFQREHNAICDRLRADFPHWQDEDLFQVARLVNSALIAKIHTVEWTPAVISHPATVIGMRANWWGLASERVRRLFGRISASEIISGIPGSPTNHFGVPYSLTEEFVAVYRMHPLIADDWSFRSAADDTPIVDYTLREITGPAALDVAREVAAPDLFYSFGTSHPGALVLNNFPRFLQEFQRPDGKLTDLAATDILRSRELGVPRYNEFRRLLRLNPFPDFASLTDDAKLAETLREVYDGDIEQVDVTIGMFAERRPRGFAFSDTAFRIFVLMASRRLNSDRFITRDYTPEVYTRAGLDWIDNNTMGSVLLRHHPELRPALRDVRNAFTPWRRTSG